MTAGTLRVVSLPSWPDNPHQEQLAAALGGHRVNVHGMSTRRWFALPVLRARPDVVHFHAPDHFVVYSASGARAWLALVSFALQLLVLRGCGVRVVWTVHDLVNHEGRHRHLDRLCRRLTGRLAHAVVVHCAVAEGHARVDFGVPETKIFVIPHGHYVDQYPTMFADRRAARAHLGWSDDTFVFLFLGNLRQHKGLPELVDAFRALDEDGARLVIRGMPFTPRVADDLHDMVRGMPHVTFVPGFVPAAEVATCMQAADIVVCPHTSALTSGSLALAMSCGRACIAPRLGCLGEMLPPDGGFAYEPREPGALLDALRTAVAQRHALEAMGQRNLEAIRRHDWPSIGRRTAEVYRACLAGRIGSST